jgi:hypothetical protein
VTGRAVATIRRVLGAGKQERRMAMKRVFAPSLWLALFVAAAGCAASYGQTDLRASARSPGSEVDVSYFYESLSPYGQWFQQPSYGWCWTPYDVSAGWRPYSDGRWEYTDYGWSWASNEPWGWATYHYGRWFFDDSYGWAWVPGTEWAPAWVAWRTGDDYVGWAPLPPRAGWDVSIGLTFADASAIPPDEWCFVPRAHVLDAGLRLQVILVARNVTLFGRSRDATRFEVRGGRPANVGLDVAQVEGFVGRSVPRVKIVDVDKPARGSGQPAGSGGVGFFRPTVRPSPVQQVPVPAVAERRNPIPDVELQRLRDQQQRKLESDLKTEQTRLVRDQQNELRSHVAGPGADEIRKQHAAEQQAFEAHAAQQRQVLTQRIQKQVVNPGKVKNAGKSDGKGKRQDKRGK